MQKEFCLNCDYEDELLPIRELAIYLVRGEEIEVTQEYYKCPICGESFINSRGHDMFNEAYRKYRQRHGMLQPEEIRQLREQYGLTQKELAMLLGWKENNINRYENGSLQKKSEDKLLKYIRKPSNFIQLKSKKPAKIIEHSTEQGLQLGH